MPAWFSSIIQATLSSLQKGLSKIYKGRIPGDESQHPMATNMSFYTARQTIMFTYERCVYTRDTVPAIINCENKHRLGFGTKKLATAFVLFTASFL